MSQDITVNQETVDAAAAIKAQLKAEGGTVPIPEGVLQTYLETKGGTEAEIVKGQKLQSGFQNALDLAVGEVMIEHMAKNTDIRQMSAQAKVGSQKYDITVRHTHNISAGVGKGRTNVHGHISTSITIPGQAEKQRIAKTLQSKAAAAFAGIDE